MVTRAVPEKARARSRDGVAAGDDGDVRQRSAGDPAARREHPGLPEGLLWLFVQKDGLLSTAVRPQRQDGVPSWGRREDGAEGEVS